MAWREGLLRAGRSVPPLAWDIALAVALFVIPAIEIREESDPGGHRLEVATILMAMQAAVLVARRSHPVAVWMASGALVSVYGIGNFPDPTLQYSALVAVYTVAAVTSPRTANRAGVVTLIVLVAVLVADRRAEVADWLVASLSVTCAWLFGTAIRTQRAYGRELAERADRLERDREEQARRAVADERLRLARELHDIAAHHVSVIALHAEAGEALLPAHPERAADAFHTIGNAARSTLTDLRRVLGVLRASHEGDAPRSPLPTLTELPALVGEVERAGLPVRVTVEGTPRSVAAAVETSAYRIVQEALTNVLRHAGPAQATVRLRYEVDALAVEVTDDGRGPTDGTNRAHRGHGLIGMSERVASFGGSFSADVRPEGGFAVSARLPL